MLWVLFLNTFLKIFFLLTPFAAISGLISMTQGKTPAEKRSVAVRTTIAMLVIVSIIFFFGQYIFSLFGITLDAFRIGGGVLLLLAGIGMVRGGNAYEAPKGDDDISVVPMAVPLIVGPGTIATLFIMGSELPEVQHRIVALLAVLTATLLVGIMMFTTALVEQKIKQKIITVLSKITGLILASIAAQLIFDGINGLMKIQG